MFLNAVKMFASPSPPSQTQYNGEHFAAEFRRVRRKEGGGGGGRKGSRGSGLLSGVVF